MNTPHNCNYKVSAALVGRLYTKAERLERDWSNAGLSDDFGTRMIVAVVRYLERIGTARKDGTRRNPTEQAAYAVWLLGDFWNKNARRDAGRRTARIAAGRECQTVPLDLLADGAAVVSFDHQLRDYLDSLDLFGGDSGQRIATILQERGWPRERAWAFVLYHLYAGDAEMVRHLMAERFDLDLTYERLRTWNSRYWAKGRAVLAAALAADVTADSLVGIR